MARDERFAYDGLSKIAHAVRRVGAAQIAMGTTEPGTPIEEVMAVADQWAEWIGGEAAKQEQAEPKPAPLGQPWEDRDKV